MSRSLMHPRMLERMGGFYPSVCSIQEATTVATTFGSLAETWGDLADHTHIACSMAALVESSPAEMQVRRPTITYEDTTHHIALKGYYPAITIGMRAEVEGEVFDIRAVEHDSQHKTTRLRANITS